MKGISLAKYLLIGTLSLFKNPNYGEALQIMAKILFIFCTFPEAGNRIALFKVGLLFLAIDCPQEV